MTELLLSKTASRQLNSILKLPPHALLICGPPGTGKTALAELVSAQLLGIPLEKLSVYPYFTRIQKPAGKQDIPIEAVREVIRQLRLKPVSPSREIMRIVLIEDAHLMSAEAQNALLKAIEEPPPATIFILSSLSDMSVLPTIASRSQRLKLGPVSLYEALEYFKKNYDDQNINSAWLLSGGAAGLMAALLRDDSQHQLKSAVENAKKLLSLSRYERLLYLDKLSGDKTELTAILDALNRILAALHRSAIDSGKANTAHKMTAARKLVNRALNSLEANTSPRLVALGLALGLPI